MSPASPIAGGFDAARRSTSNKLLWFGRHTERDRGRGLDVKLAHHTGWRLQCAVVVLGSHENAPAIERACARLADSTVMCRSRLPARPACCIQVRCMTRFAAPRPSRRRSPHRVTLLFDLSLGGDLQARNPRRMNAKCHAEFPSSILRRQRKQHFPAVSLYCVFQATAVDVTRLLRITAGVPLMDPFRLHRCPHSVSRGVIVRHSMGITM